MPDSVKIPGDGEVSRRTLIISGSVALGVIGFAWWRAGRAKAVPAEETFPGVEQPTDLAPSNLSGVTTGGGTTSTGAEFITTNDQWTQRAVAAMVDLGFDSILVSEALGKFLANQQVTQQEANWIQTAIALVGKPPIGEHSIRLITSAPSPVPSPAPAPSPGIPGRETGHKYVVQVHEFTRDTPVRDAVVRFSDFLVANPNTASGRNAVQIAVVRTIADPRNVGKIRNGIILKQRRVYLTVVKTEALRSTA